MANYKVSGADLASVADAIRTKGSTSAGLEFPDEFVSAIQNIPTGGGSTLITKNITANGTYNASSDSADGYSSVTVAVPSKLVTGTFEGESTDKGSAISVSIPYTGSGHPVAGMIYPSSGGNSGSMESVAQKNAVIMFSFVQVNTSETPTYSGNTSNNKATVTTLYKYSDSDATSTTASRSPSTQIFNNANASATASECVKIKDATTMSVFIANTSYGFKDGIEYTYQIVYSA